MPGESNVFTRPSSLFRPHNLSGQSLNPNRKSRSLAVVHFEVNYPFCNGPEEKMVETPGTAPGSDTLIAHPFIAIAGCPAPLIWRYPVKFQY